jgi:hypothetical protein
VDVNLEEVVSSSEPLRHGVTKCGELRESASGMMRLNFLLPTIKCNGRLLM